MNIGLLVRLQSFWIGIHYSNYNRRFCINILPCITIWVTLKNGVIITDRKNYVNNIIVATNNITIAEEALKDHKDLLKVLETTLKSFDEEVEA